MGPDKTNYALYLDGKRIAEIEEIEGSDTLTVCAHGEGNAALSAEYFKPLGYWDETVSFRLSKHMRCRSRKRFVKLLMGTGVQRNTANGMARNVPFRNRWGLPGATYQIEWLNALFLRMTLQEEPKQD